MGQPMGRRAALTLPLAAGASGLARRAHGQPVPGTAAQRTLRFVPYSNLIATDPVWSISVISLEHAFMTCDQLYGIDDRFVPRPQMAAGHEVSDDGLRWRFALRDGLRFHDGEPVRAADCVASIARWAKRDPFGQRMAALADEMRVTGDRDFEIRLKRPFAQMLYGLGATTCFIRPERLARTDAFQQITDQTGSGPFRFLPDEFMSGSRVAYARHDGYVPRQEPPVMWSGGKMAYFDRVEWHILPDAATAAAALRTGEVDWVERPLLDLVPALQKAPGVTVRNLHPLGLFSILWLNTAAPPFDNPKLRHALLPAVQQTDFMLAVVGDQPDLMRDGVGFFTPASPFASAAGLDVLTGPRSLATARRLVAESGYKGERVVLMVSDVPESIAMAQVAQALFKELGLVVDYQTMDYGTLAARSRSTDPAVRAGWSCYCIAWAGLWPTNPGSNVPLAGYTPDPAMAALRAQWFEAADLPTQKAVADRMQLRAVEQPPFIPLGQFFVPHAFRSKLSGFVPAPITAFWNVRAG